MSKQYNKFQNQSDRFDHKKQIIMKSIFRPKVQFKTVINRNENDEQTEQEFKDVNLSQSSQDNDMQSGT